MKQTKKEYYKDALLGFVYVTTYLFLFCVATGFVMGMCARTGISEDENDLRNIVYTLDENLDFQEYNFEGTVCQLNYKICKAERILLEKDCFETMTTCEINANKKWHSIRKSKEDRGYIRKR
jgi:hypothetical protein